MNMPRIVPVVLMTAIAYAQWSSAEEGSTLTKADQPTAEATSALPDSPPDAVVRDADATDATSDPRPLDCPEKPEKKAVARKLAGRLFADARSAYSEEDYLTALERFLCSMKMVEHENTVTNIEKTVEAEEDKVGALVLIEAYLENAPESELNEEIANIAAPLAQAIAEEERNASEAAVEAVEEEATAPECPEIELSQTTVPQNDDAKRFLMISGWSEIGVGSAVFIAAIILQATAAAAKNNAASASRYDTFLDEREKYRTLQVGATGMFIAGIVVASVGVTHLYLAKRQENGDALSRKERFAPVTLVTRPGWIALEGTF